MAGRARRQALINLTDADLLAVAPPDLAPRLQALPEHIAMRVAASAASSAAVSSVTDGPSWDEAQAEIYRRVAGIPVDSIAWPD